MKLAKLGLCERLSLFRWTVLCYVNIAAVLLLASLYFGVPQSYALYDGIMALAAGILATPMVPRLARTARRLIPQVIDNWPEIRKELRRRIGR